MSVLRNILLATVATAGLAACQKEKPTTPAVATTAASTDTTAVTVSPQATPVAQPEIVYVNSDSLLSNYQYFKDAKARLETKSQRLERDLRAKADAFQKEVGQYQQNAGTLTEAQRASTEQRLAQKQQQLGTQQQTASSQLATDENEEMKKIYEKVEAYLKKLSQERGYKMVLTYTRGNSAILYAESSLDITNDVIAALNDDYKSSKAPAKK